MHNVKENMLEVIQNDGMTKCVKSHAPKREPMHDFKQT